MADESRSKTELTKVFGVASTLSYVSNLLLGILFALFFGQDQPDSSNLNWGNYHGGTPGCVGESDIWLRCSVCSDRRYRYLFLDCYIDWGNPHGRCLRRSRPRGRTRLENPDSISGGREYSTCVRSPVLVGLQRDCQIHWNFYDSKLHGVSSSLGSE